jgi:hypothetical protein
MICGVPSPGVLAGTEGMAGVTPGGVVDDRLFLRPGYKVPAGNPSGVPKGVDRLEGGEPTGPVKVGMELLIGGAGSIG